MRRDPRWTAVPRTWAMPTALAISSLAPACGGKDDTTQTDPGTASEPDTTGTTGLTDDPTGTTGELPDCSLYDEDPETCASFIACLHLTAQGACIVRCQNFDDQATCEAQAYCYWEDGCYLAV